MNRHELPLFPLSSVVLFPGCLAPLHVFEPRYRQMTSDALTGGRSIGMICVRQGFEGEMTGDPPLHEVGCAGFASEHQKLADGRYHLVLRGTHRFRIVQELPRQPGRLYRVAKVERLEEVPPLDAARMGELRQLVIDRLGEIARRSAESTAELAFERLGALDDAAFTHTLCQALGLPAAEKQGLLEAPSIEERLSRLEGLLLFHVAALTGPSGAPQAIH